METTNNTNPIETPERKPYHINVAEAVPFNAVGELKITNTDELGKIINDVFSAAFDDYYGCKLQVQVLPDRGAVVTLSLVFQILNTDQYKGSTVAFHPMFAAPDGTNPGERVRLLTQISTSDGVKVFMTKDCKDAISEFVISPNAKNQPITDWSTYYHGIRTDYGTYVEVTKLDLTKIVKKIFGEKDEFDSELFYQITPTYKINTMNQYKAIDTWVLNILRLNNDNEIATANLLGMYVAPKSGINVITATSK